jgi:hypothetical protein
MTRLENKTLTTNLFLYSNFHWLFPYLLNVAPRRCGGTMRAGTTRTKHPGALNGNLGRGREIERYRPPSRRR